MTTMEIFLRLNDRFRMKYKFTDEAAFKKAVKSYLEYVPHCYIVRYNANIISGVPDILVCFNGRFVALELKDDTGKASKQQEDKIEKIKDAGGIAVVCDCMDDVYQALLQAISYA